MHAVIPIDFSTAAPPPEPLLREAHRLARRAALLLARETGLPVRTGTTPTSASAFVRGFAPRLGVTASLISSLGVRPWGEDFQSWRARRDAASRVIAIDVTADAEWLRDPRQAVVGSFGREYANPAVASVEEAVTWVRENCRTSPRDRPSPDSWSEELVYIPAETGSSQMMHFSLAESVSLYGPLYGGEVTAEVLARNHGISEESAIRIARAIRRYTLWDDEGGSEMS